MSNAWHTKDIQKCQSPAAAQATPVHRRMCVLHRKVHHYFPLIPFLSLFHCPGSVILSLSLSLNFTLAYSML